MPESDSPNNQTNRPGDSEHSSQANLPDGGTVGQLDSTAESQAITSEARRRLRAILEPAESSTPATAVEAQPPSPQLSQAPPGTNQDAPQSPSQPAYPGMTDARPRGQLMDENAQAQRKAQLRAILMQSYAEQQKLSEEMQKEIFGSASEDEATASDDSPLPEHPRTRSKLLESKSNDVFPPFVLVTVLLVGSLAIGCCLWFGLHPSGPKAVTTAAATTPPGATTTATSTTGTAVLDLVKSAEAAYQQKNYSDALAYLENALKQDNKNADLLARHGKVETMLKENDKAIADYTAAIALDSQKSNYIIERAYNFYRVGKYKEASDDYSTVLALKPDSTDALFGRALAFRQMAQSDKARGDLEKLLSLKPAYFAANIELGNIFYEAADYRQAVKSYTQALTANPQYADGYFLRAAALLKSQKIKDALKDYNLAIKLNSGNPDYYNDRGYAYLKLNKLKEACSDFQDALSRNPEHKLAKENLAAAQGNGK